jgi:hypothetical protein
MYVLINLIRTHNYEINEFFNFWNIFFVFQQHIEIQEFT